MTVSLDSSLAPGCFGSALVFREDASECKGCPFASGCQPKSAATLARLREELNIDSAAISASMVKRKPATVKSGEKLVRSLPVKVQQLIDQIDKKGINVRDKILAGQNPFDSPAFLRVAAHIMLKMPAGVDRTFLKVAFQHKFNWTDGTAAAHAGQVFSMMTALNIGTVSDGKLKIKRTNNV